MDGGIETAPVQFDSNVRLAIERAGIVAVLIVDHVDDAVPVARALLDGGVRAMELTLRTSAAMDSLRRIRSEVPEMLAGMGTVLSVEQIEAIHSAGAQFAVAPGTNPRVIAAAQRRALPFAPGIATPSDLEAAIEQGCRLVKFFPAEPLGGLSYLQSLAAPYAHLGLQYIPLGGINADNMGHWLGERSVAAVGGSWLAPRQLIEDSQWDTIRQRAAAAVEIVRRCRPDRED